MSNLVIPDGGNIGSASDTDAISIAANGKPTFSQGIANTGTIDAGTLGSSVVVPASIGGSMHLIQKQTASATSQLIFTVSSYSAYRDLVFVFENIAPSQNDVTFRCRINTDGSDTYVTGSYHTVAYYVERNMGNGNAGSSQTGNSSSEFITIGGLGSGTADTGVSGQMKVFNHQSTTTFKSNIYDVSHQTHNDFFIRRIGHGTYRGTKDALTKIMFEMSSNTVASGSITLYGVKDA